MKGVQGRGQTERGGGGERRERKKRIERWMPGRGEKRRKRGLREYQEEAAEATARHKEEFQVEEERKR